MRYNTTERLGIVKSNEIILKEFDWIFREQSISDVGIDAIIEVVENGMPLGKLIASQIKSGKGNFHINEKTLTYYVSNIHYNYWINLNIPVIMIAYLPENDCIYWSEISIQTLKKTKKKWKIEISKKNILNKKSKPYILKLLEKKPQRNPLFELYKGDIERDTINDLVEKTSSLYESVNSINELINHISNFGKTAKELNIKLKEFANRGLNNKSPEVKSSFKGFAKKLNIISSRAENEILIYSQVFSEGFYAYEQIYQLNKNLNQDINLSEVIMNLSKIPSSIDIGIEGILNMRNAFDKLPKNKFPVLKETRLNLLEVADLIIFEFNVSKRLIFKFIDNT